MWTFSKRVSCPPPGALVNGRKADGGSMAFAWFVFHRDHKSTGQKPTVGWIDWRNHATEEEMAGLKRKRTAA